MPQNLKLRGNVWWFRKRVQGKDQEISLETDNLGVAKARRDRLLQELREQGGARWGENRRHTFNDAAERFGKEHFKTLKDTSRVRYIVSISNLLKIFDNVPLCEISSVKLGEFEQRRRCEGVTNSTIRRDLACLSVIFSTAEEWEWVAKNPVKPYLRGRAKRGLKEGDPRTRYLGPPRRDCPAPGGLPEGRRGHHFCHRHRPEEKGTAFAPVEPGGPAGTRDLCGEGNV